MRAQLSRNVEGITLNPLPQLLKPKTELLFSEILHKVLGTFLLMMKTHLVLCHVLSGLEVPLRQGLVSRL